MGYITVGKRDLVPLTQQELIFVSEYLGCFNARRSGLRAGYPRKVACEQCPKWVQPDGPKKNVFQAVQAGMQARMNRLNVTADNVIAELAKIGFANMMNYVRFDADNQPMVDLTEISSDAGAAIKKITVEEFKEGRGESAREVRRVQLELHDKKTPLLALAKHTGALGGPGGGNVTFRTSDDGEDDVGFGDGDGTTINNFNINLIPHGHHFHGDEIIDGTTIDGEVVPEEET